MMAKQCLTANLCQPGPAHDIIPLMKKTIIDVLDEMAVSSCDRSFIPGHKGRAFAGEGARNFEKALDGIYPFDVTETDKTDNLNYPEGVFRDAEEYAASLFGVRKTLFSVNGSTAGVIASVIASVKDNGTLLLPMNSHISCYYGAMHANAKVKRLYISDHIVGVTPEEIREAVDGENDIAAAVITGPTYPGNCPDWEKIVPILHEKGITVIADESHGTHLSFSDRCPEGAVSAGADLIIHSGHKTIGGLTQTGMLHINSDSVDPDDVRFALRTVMSTSPSYILSGSLFRALKELSDLPAKLMEISEEYAETVEELSGLTRFSVLKNKRQDPMKLAVVCRCDTAAAARMLEDRYGIIPEMVWGPVIVFMFGQGTRREDLFRIRDAFRQMDGIMEYRQPKDLETIPSVSTAMSMSRAISRRVRKVPFKESSGLIAADFVGAYPPGAPVIIPGDVINRDIIEYVSSSDNVVGLWDGNANIRVVRE